MQSGNASSLLGKLVEARKGRIPEHFRRTLRINSVSDHQRFLTDSSKMKIISGQTKSLKLLKIDFSKIVLGEDTDLKIDNMRIEIMVILKWIMYL